MMLSIWVGYGRRNKIKLPYRMQKVNRKKKTQHYLAITNAEVAIVHCKY